MWSDLYRQRKTQDSTSFQGVSKSKSILDSLYCNKNIQPDSTFLFCHWPQPYTRTVTSSHLCQGLSPWPYTVLTSSPPCIVQSPVFRGTPTPPHTFWIQFQLPPLLPFFEIISVEPSSVPKSIFLPHSPSLYYLLIWIKYIFWESCFLFYNYACC